MNILLSSVISGVSSLIHSLSSLNDTLSPGLGGNALASLIFSALAIISLLGMIVGIGAGTIGAVGAAPFGTISGIFASFLRLFTMRLGCIACQCLNVKKCAVHTSCNLCDRLTAGIDGLYGARQGTFCILY